MKETNLDLMRHLLGSIDLSDFQDEKEMSEEDRKNYVAAISNAFKWIEKDIKKGMYEQLLFTFSHSDDMDKITLGQGTVNGMSILLEKWTLINQEYEKLPSEEKPFDKHNPIGEF